MPQTTNSLISAATLQQWLADGAEIALLDVREAGQFGEGHPFFAIPAAYSRLELDVPRLVPRRSTRVVLIDAGDGIADNAAQHLQALGYSQVSVLEGGAPAWAAAGYVLFKGVNLPSKTFGELVEHAFGTPHISAHELLELQQSGKPFVLLDGRTLAEHQKMTIPGALNVPNGELPARWRHWAADETTPLVIHCAGRTRSIIGAEILRSFGVPNPVIALENGTQGWALAGLKLEHGSPRNPLNDLLEQAADPRDQAAARHQADHTGAPQLTAAQAQEWIDDTSRNCFVLDVRTAQEFAAGTLAGAQHAPGGQLLQATDQTVGVRGARILVLDDEAVRAPVIASWLYRLGYEAATVESGVHAALHRVGGQAAPAVQALTPVHRADLASWVQTQKPALLDLQSSLAYRQQHAQGAHWTLRPRIVATVQSLPSAPAALLLISSDEQSAQLAAQELQQAGWSQLHWTTPADWLAAGLPVEASADLPSDEEAIDYLFFVHDRHDGNLDAARRYLEWETGLIAQCTPQELASFRLPAAV